jgi:chaperonin GroEL
VALVRAEQAIDALIEDADGDIATGLRILRASLESPLRQLVDNGGGESAVIVNDVRAAEQDIGYDVARTSFGNMFDLGIVDPVKVVRVALENAVSVAAIMLTTEAVVGEIPEEQPPAPPMGDGMGMDDMGMGGMGF